MTISDFIMRLTRVQKEMNRGLDPQVKIGKQYNNTEDCFDYFDIKSVDGDVILVPSDRWDRKSGERK